MNGPTPTISGLRDEMKSISSASVSYDEPGVPIIIPAPVWNPRRFRVSVERNNVDHPGNIVKNTISVKHYFLLTLHLMSPIHRIANVVS